MTIVYMFTKTIVQGYLSVFNGDARSPSSRTKTTPNGQFSGLNRKTELENSLCLEICF